MRVVLDLKAWYKITNAMTARKGGLCRSRQDAGTSKSSTFGGMKQMRARKLNSGEVRLDLGEFLPAGKKFWWSSEVDDIVQQLRNQMPDMIVGVSHEIHVRSSVGYQVLHVKVQDMSAKSLLGNYTKLIINGMNGQRGEYGEPATA